MKFKEYLAELNKMAKEQPDKLECEMIYSHDDEGNFYQKVHNMPAFVQVEDLTQYDLEIVGFDGDENIAIEDCNAIIIN